MPQGFAQAQGMVSSAAWEVNGFQRIAQGGATPLPFADRLVDLPEQPAMSRLALDREGRVLVALCDGSILCLGR